MGKIWSRSGAGNGGWLFHGREHKPGSGGCGLVRGRLGGRPGRWIALSAVGPVVGVREMMEPGVCRPSWVQGVLVSNKVELGEVLAVMGV